MLFGPNPDRQEDFVPDMAKLMLIDSASLELSDPEDSVQSGGLTCKARFWNPNSYNAQANAGIKLVLTEYADPGCQATYFLVPNPKARVLHDDELILSTYRRSILASAGRPSSQVIGKPSTGQGVRNALAFDQYLS